MQGWQARTVREKSVRGGFPAYPHHMGRGKRRGHDVPAVRRSGLTASAPVRERDYDALWRVRYDRARRAGMSTGMARLVANREVHHQHLADKGLTPVGTGDIEELY